MFDVLPGINFSSQTLSAPKLARSLCRTASFIQNIEPYVIVLQRYDDWWEHEGLHFYKATLSIHDLFEMVKSPQSLLAAMPGEESVFVGIAPSSRLWYLRFYLSWDDEGFELSGRFDLTLPEGLMDSFKSWMLGVLEMEEQDSKTYYNKIRL